jgi:hypothetical protein
VTELSWKNAVKQALNTYSLRHSSVLIDRAGFLNEQLSVIVISTGSLGKTPSQTVSRVLQELRDEGYLYFSKSGSYVLNHQQLDAANEDVPEDVLDNALNLNTLQLKDVDAFDKVQLGRIRSGIAALRKATLQNYNSSCALCDVKEGPLLVTSHIARWADRPEARGNLSNTICFCAFHDKLFESGYFALSDSFDVIRKPGYFGAAISVWMESHTIQFKAPYRPPSIEFLSDHRHRVGLVR